MTLYSISSLAVELAIEPPPPRRVPLPKRPAAFVPHPTPSAAPTVAAAQPPRPTQRTRPVSHERAAAAGSASERTSASSAGALGLEGSVLPVDAWDQGRSGHGHGGGQSEDELGAGSTAQAFDAEALLDLLPTSGDSGIFEVLLPDGETMAVVTDVRDSLASFLLAAGSDKLRAQLQAKRLELEGGLSRRMGRAVRLAVL